MTSMNREISVMMEPVGLNSACRIVMKMLKTMVQDLWRYYIKIRHKMIVFLITDQKLTAFYKNVKCRKLCIIYMLYCAVIKAYSHGSLYSVYFITLCHS